LWEASAYILSRVAARKLLDALPANGPIDLWMNFRFEDIRTFTTSTQLIEQRLAEPSTNAYSILPVLSQVGSVSREKILVLKAKRVRGPVIAVGTGGSGLTALAVAISTLGYSVASNLLSLPEKELAELSKRRRGAAFDAFVNVGVLDGTLLERVLANKNALLIVTDGRSVPHGIPENRILRLTPDLVDKWDHLSRFLKVDYPSFPYPHDPDLGQRALDGVAGELSMSDHTDLEWDKSPWIMPTSRVPGGLGLSSSRAARNVLTEWRQGAPLADELWLKRADTFPSNMTIFKPSNVTVDATLNLTLRPEKSLVRDFSGAAIALRAPNVYGSFSAWLCPARGSGIITGLFLHRSGPRQEIDIEFLGKDTTKMLVNVFYNPGAPGTKLEYGYRGTPTEIDLGFDAADEFHHYEIEWRSERIVWKVDGAVVYQRREWEPTPIPDRPLEFNINIWTSRSIEFSGQLELQALPATTRIKDIFVTN
jgi:hypothetical protein